MSTQDASLSVPISYTQVPVGVRLLELPSELDELIRCGGLKTMCLKSAQALAQPPHSGAISSGSMPEAQHAVLCTDLRTFQLRQVQTSNTVLVARARDDQSSIDTETGNELDVGCRKPSFGLHTFTTCSSSLELKVLDADLIAATKLKTAEQWLRELAPEYSEISHEIREPENGVPIKKGSAQPQPQPHSKSKHCLFDDVPYSQSECEDAWLALCGFEIQGRAFRSPASFMLRIWREVFQSFDLSHNIDRDALYHVTTEAQQVPHESIDSILQRISSPSPAPSVNPACQNTDTSNGLKLDPKETVTWIGEVYYATLLYHSDISDSNTSMFSLGAWRSLLPEAWQHLVDLDLLRTLRPTRFRPVAPLLQPSSAVDKNRSCGIDDTNWMELVRKVEAGHTNEMGGLDANLKSAKKAGRNRNWHEQFKKSRPPQSVV